MGTGMPVWARAVVLLVLAALGALGLWWMSQQGVGGGPPLATHLDASIQRQLKEAEQTRATNAAEVAAREATKASRCAATDAVYQLRNRESLTLRFMPVRTLYATAAQEAALLRGFPNPSFADITVVLEEGERRYRFGVLRSSGYSLNYLIPVERTAIIQVPRLDELIQLSLFDEVYAYMPDVPAPQTAAPQYVLAPGLSRWLHPRSGNFGTTNIGVGFFDFVRCEPQGTGAGAGAQ